MIRSHIPRTRERSNGRYHEVGYYHYHNYNGSTGILSTVFDHKYFETYKEHMEDCINPYGSRGFRSIGPCKSWKATRLGDYSATWNDVYQVYSSLRHIDIDPNHIDLSALVSLLPDVPKSIIADNCVAAQSKMITQIPTIVSVANFIYELKDFKSSFDHYKKALTKGGLRIKDVPGWANSTFLDFNFNLLPFVGDLQKMTTIYDRVVSRLNFLRNNRGIPVRQSFRNQTLWDENPLVGLKIQENTATPPYSHFGPENDYNPYALIPYNTYMGWAGDSGPFGGWDLFVDSYKAEFNAVWYLYQELEGLDDAWALVRGLIAGTGLNNPAKIVWNAIPFSFILDWLAPFGNALDRLAVQPFTGRWDVYDVTHSVKETWQLRQVRKYYCSDAGFTTFENNLVVQKYHRDLGLNFNILDFDLTDLTKQQQLLLTSLGLGLTLFRNGKKSGSKA